ncbi:hypothetical protein HYDPIDRAFT_155982 [Hydnomerulius pinastri MD-312]|uniref:Neuroguidin n=1 Tax=Hydnomerulius pinastri MD-312 TaxID=994086 RepID=A0A0C9VY71_9AGAM|nr:hypothetical protein HYDPIDRAFT_155982 [Hydnomerulius pinastri MD-312]
MSDHQSAASVLDEMTVSMGSVRELMKSLKENQSSTDDLDMRDGISLLSLKHHLMLSYLQSLVLLSARRATGDSLEIRTAASAPFSTVDRDARGSGIGDLVDSMIEGRVVLEKIKVLESRMRYQIEKLVRVADDASKNVTDDPLAFRPNPQNLVNNDQGSDAESDEDQNEQEESRDGIYRPPKLAPMPYTETAGDKRSKRQPIPKALSSLLHQDPSRPHIESSSGLGSMPALASDRAREIQRMTEFEEENFTRLMMNKKDTRRRKRDEEDLALGGTGSSQGRRRGGGLEDEFGDVLRSVGRTRMGAIGDGYEELRQKGKKSDALSRSRTRRRDNADGGDEETPQAKRGRFERERRALSKRMTKVRRK